jgi:hypothetical protein
MVTSDELVDWTLESDGGALGISQGKVKNRQRANGFGQVLIALEQGPRLLKAALQHPQFGQLSDRVNTARLHATLFRLPDGALEFIFGFIQLAGDEIHPSTACSAECREVPISGAGGKAFKRAQAIGVLEHRDQVLGDSRCDGQFAPQCARTAGLRSARSPRRP